MGNSNNKISDLPTQAIIRRMDECLLTSDRDALIGYLDMLDSKFQVSYTPEKNAKDFKESSGVQVILKIMRKMLNEELVFRSIMEILGQLRNDVSVSTAIIQYGGIDLLHRALVQYDKHDYLSAFIPEYLKTILAVGSKVAILEIRKESTYLRLCKKCQEVVERELMLETGAIDTKLPKPIDRINRIIMFMKNYMTRDDVQCAALDCIITFCKNADAKSGILETKLITTMCSTLINFPLNYEIVWRVCMAFSIMATFQDEIANDIANNEIHDLLAKNYYEFKDEPRIQQQILWMLKSFLLYFKTKKKIQRSETCMKLFNNLMDARSELMRKTAFSTQEKFKPYEVVVPLEIRLLLRETKGKVLIEHDVEIIEKPKELTSQERRREKILENKPLYGTLATRHFKKGETGLLDSNATRHEELMQVKKPPEWEKYLQYGENGRKKRKMNKVKPI
mmetsp:Transcript_16418/g.14809  ORF Transcript_16418/g.14809 Transcript_16418/m.14809 type:complete len:451 (-) Transcript_16418:53-1405(-)